MPSPSPGPVVTFDLFSALIDSRTGGGAALGRLARTHSWRVDGHQVYDRWPAAPHRARAGRRRPQPEHEVQNLSELEPVLRLMAGATGDARSDAEALAADG